MHEKQVASLVKKLGNIPLSDLDLKREAHALKIPDFLGVRMQDENMPDGNGCYIINTDIHTGPGVHWLAVVQKNKVCYVYDSFGRQSGGLVKFFRQNRVNRGYRIQNTDTSDQDQYGTRSVTCGQRCLSALKIYKSHGLDYYMQL